MARGTVIVTSGPERAALGTVRALADHGYRVIMTAVRAPALGLRSRSAFAHHVVPDPLGEPDGFAAAITRLARTYSADAIVPGCDASLGALSARRDQLEGSMVHAFPSDGDVRRALDKVSLIDAANAVGLCPPRTEVCRSESAALAAADRLGMPTIVKPQFSVVERGDRREQHGSGLVRTDDELRELLGRLGPLALVQAPLSGATYSLGGVATPDGLLGMCFARYVRTWPAAAGNAAFAITETPPPGLVPVVEDLVTELKWQGVFELEFIRDGDGRMRPIDFNPRVYGSVTLSAAAGANLPALWCDHVLGHGPTRATARPGQRYRWEDGDVRHVGRLLAAGQPARAAGVLVPRRGTTHAYFRVADPAPLAGRLIDVATVAARRLRRRMASRSSIS